MNSDYDPSRLDLLLQHLFDESIYDSQVAELNAILLVSPRSRGHYRKSLRLHAALIRHRQTETSVQTPPPSPPARWRRVAPRLAIAACLLLAALYHWIPNQKPLASLTGTTAAIWAGASATADLDHPMDLVAGFAEVTYQNGVRVILEGPCRFAVTSPMSMSVTHGRATVKVPHPVTGFHLDTPAGRMTDLGTEFGIAVGSGVEGPVVLTEVFNGEIEIPGETTARKRLYGGDSLAIVREGGGTKLLSALGEYRVNLGDSARRLPPSNSSPETGNLARGKPVTSSAHYSMPHGSVFPPATLTDGRLNDSGSPGDWSFWLAPNGENGEFTVDLLDAREIGRIDLQNTRNRTHGDRGMREIRIMTSTDGSRFEELLHTELPWIPELPPPGVDFPFESLRFPPVNARYVKVVGISHYSHPERSKENTNHGGGLNEIRIFAP